MDLVQEEFLQRLNFYQHSWLPARALVEEALAQRFKVNLAGGLRPGMLLGRLVSWASCSYLDLATHYFPFRWTLAGR